MNCSLGSQCEEREGGRSIEFGFGCLIIGLEFECLGFGFEWSKWKIYYNVYSLS